jgi:hypothetical protein
MATRVRRVRTFLDPTALMVTVRNFSKVYILNTNINDSLLEIFCYYGIVLYSKFSLGHLVLSFGKS